MLKPKYFKFSGLNHKEDVVEQVGCVSGNWLKNIYFDNELWFNIDDPEPFLLEGENKPIASDCGFRQDLLYLKNGNKVKAQEYKEVLENQ